MKTAPQMDSIDIAEFNVKKKPIIVDSQAHSNASIYSQDERQTKKKPEKLEKGKVPDFITENLKKLESPQSKGSKVERRKPSAQEVTPTRKIELNKSEKFNNR